MWCLRSPNSRTAGIIGGVGAVVLVAAVSLVADGALASAIAAVGILDAIVIGLGAVLSALVAVAGILLAADMRADRECARTWQSLGNPAAWTIEQSVDENKTHSWHHAYAAGSQDQHVQAILRAHRVATPTTTPHDSGVATGSFADIRTNKKRGSASIDTEISVAGSNLGSEMIETTVRQHGLTLVANSATVTERDARAMRSRPPRLVRSMSAVPKVRRVANTERWWTTQVVGAELAPWSVAFRCAADVIVLADRGGRNHPPSPPDYVIDSTAQAQPACRGPPCHANAGRSSSTQDAFGRRHRPKDDAATEPDALIVVDNLGDRVPVGAAELSVIETFLDDVLRDVLTRVDCGQDNSTT